MSLLKFLNAFAGGPDLDYYKGSQTTFDLQEYFTGRIEAWGFVQDRKGHVTRRFDVIMDGAWEGGNGTLKEQFRYYDGETQERTWTIKKIADNRYEGTAGDILDKAVGVIEGNAMRWAYRMDLPVGNTVYRLAFDDWMFLMNDGILINRSYLKKFGITVAELTLFMQKQERQ
ncbi:MAG: DUF3833 domain-containing protein [Hyphomicrobiales bacterium]|nr:DUF3833 domain-containing protein [Hyphomicrobiales bacterium]